MDNSDFVTVFNIVEFGYRQWWFGAIGIIIGIFFGITVPLLTPVALRFIPYSSEKRAKQVLIFRWVFLAAALLWSLMVFIGTYGDYRTCSNALASGNAFYVEGTVDNFVPMPYQGHADESFNVKGVPFSYSDFGVTAGFNNTSSHGGPIRAGQYVRVWYLGNEILKLQIKKDSVSAVTNAGGG